MSRSLEELETLCKEKKKSVIKAANDDTISLSEFKTMLYEYSDLLKEHKELKNKLDIEE